MLGQGIDNEALALLPAPVDGRLVDARPARDVLDGQGREPGFGELGGCRGEHGRAHFRAATAEFRTLG